MPVAVVVTVAAGTGAVIPLKVIKFSDATVLKS